VVRTRGQHFNLGLAMYKAGRHDEAVPEFAQVLAVDPSNVVNCKDNILLAASAVSASKASSATGT
jgi:hypothetical protein